jgi:hypothetical protein
MKWYATYRGKMKLHATTTFKYIIVMYFLVSIQLLINLLVYVNISCTICSSIPHKNIIQNLNIFCDLCSPYSHISIVTMKSYLLCFFICFFMWFLLVWIHTETVTEREELYVFPHRFLAQQRVPPWCRAEIRTRHLCTLWKEGALNMLGNTPHCAIPRNEFCCTPLGRACIMK